MAEDSAEEAVCLAVPEVREVLDSFRENLMGCLEEAEEGHSPADRVDNFQVIQMECLEEAESGAAVRKNNFLVSLIICLEGEEAGNFRVVRVDRFHRNQMGSLLEEVEAGEVSNFSATQMGLLHGAAADSSEAVRADNFRVGLVGHLAVNLMECLEEAGVGNFPEVVVEVAADREVREAGGDSAEEICSSKWL